MTQPTDKVREAFEAWHSDYYGVRKSAYRLIDGSYKHNSMNHEFTAWQASRTAALNEAIELLNNEWPAKCSIIDLKRLRDGE